MTFLRKTTQVVMVLLVLLMSTMLVIPPGMDLELCFGNDGHVDFSLSGCPDGVSPKVPVRERSPVHATVHHGDCLHIAVACGMTQELIRANGNSGSSSEPTNDPSKAFLLFSESLADSAGAYLDPNVYPIPFEDFPSPHLISLRAVVLLI